MDISGLKATTPVTSGAAATIEKTSQAATVANAPVVASPISQTPSSTPVAPAAPAALVAQLQALLRSSPHAAETTVQYTLDAKTGIPVITVRDAQSGRIVRQLPIDVAARLLENFSMGTGTLLDSTA